MPWPAASSPAPTEAKKEDPSAAPAQFTQGLLDQIGELAFHRQRQLVRHRHIEVNGGTVDVPSYAVHPGDEVRLRAKSKDLLPVQVALESKTKPTTVRWVAVDEGARAGRMVERPTRADIPLAVQEQLIVELYSK